MIQATDTSSTHAPVQWVSCEQELLHLSGKIQHHGALAVVSLADETITHVSANLGDMFGVSLAALLGRPWRQTPLYTPELAKTMELPGPLRSVTLTVAAPAGQWLAVAVRASTTHLILEWEHTVAVIESVPVHELLHSVVRSPSFPSELDAYYQTLVGHVRRVTGMDRAMLYRFRDDWTGEVVAEDQTGDSGSYLGLRFPAGDIPEIARRLYLQNPYRMIPDIEAPDHPVYGVTPQPPDLSRSDLRSVSPMHLEYLRNMGVRSSFSVPVVVGGKLWGLVACHRYASPVWLSHDQRDACAALASAFSLGLSSFMAAHTLRLHDGMDRKVARALQSIAGEADPLAAFDIAAPHFASLIPSDGFALVQGDDGAILGMGPDLPGLSLVDAWFMGASREPIADVQNLLEVFSDDPRVSQFAGGVLAVQVPWSGRRTLRLYWFRQAENQSIAWAGSPHKPAAEDATALRLSPRRSFEKWVEIRTGFCSEWTSNERLIAARLRRLALKWL
jgi:light-regulated signal transduction histidine kinase (bacteriophytochrome)